MKGHSMLAKHFKDLMKNIPDNQLILFDDGSEIYRPLKSVVCVQVTTEDEPGEKYPEFILLEDFKEEFDDDKEYEEYVKTMGEPPTFDALIFSTDETVVVESDDKIS
jgi:hypothetical protein